jgi:site-specific recombinase XerD
MLSRERAEKDDLVKWIETHRPVNTKKSYNTYASQYLKYVESSGLPLKSEVTLASFMKASFDRGLGRQTVTKTVPAAVANLFRFDEGVKITDSELVRQTKKVVARNTPNSVQKLPLQLSQLVDIAKTVNGGFEEVRNYFMMLIMTLGMMRESEAANLEFANVSVQMLRGEEYF